MEIGWESLNIVECKRPCTEDRMGARGMRAPTVFICADTGRRVEWDSEKVAKMGGSINATE